MVALRHVTTQFSDLAAFMTSVSGLQTAGSGGSLKLYSLSGRGGGLMVSDADTLSRLDTGQYAASAGLDAPRGLLITEIGGQQTAVAFGRYGVELETWQLSSSGMAAGRGALRFEGGTPDALLALDEVTLGGTRYFVSAGRLSEGLSVWRLQGSTLVKLAQDPGAAAPGGNAVNDLEIVTLGGQTRVLAVSAEQDAVYNYRLGAGGALEDVQRLDLRDGLYLDTPTHIEVVTVAGRSYALIGAAGSGSLAVVALTAEGGMRPTDLVGDDLATRFAGMTVLETIEVAGQVYVVAGGGDDGLTLMTLLPGGRLLHLDTIPDDLAMALTDVTALTLAADAGGIDIFAAGEWPEGPDGAGGGLTQLRADLGLVGETVQLGNAADLYNGTGGNDQIHGGGGNDTLRAGAGADVLIDGAGADTLTGGAGADVFVFTPDGETDRITDFEPGVDRLELSAMGRFYSVGDVTIQSTAHGARILFGGEVLRVDSADGRALTAADFSIEDLRDLWHIDSAALPVAALSMAGGTGADLLEGRGGADTLSGGAGGDILRGMGGDDMLLGEAYDPVFDAAAARVFRLYQATLDRAPDQGGLLNWSAALTEGGRSLVSVAAGFTNSAEFRNTYGALDNAGFVTQLYRNVLEREPDAGGLANWVARLDGGMSRAQVVAGFSESAEFVRDSAAGALRFSASGLQTDYADDVFRLYQAMLDRAPDEGGLRNWSARLAMGEKTFLQVIEGFENSAEFQNTYGSLDDEGFVTRLYNNVLDRNPDAGGLANWVARLEDGMSRAQVVRGLAQSAEFQASSEPELLRWTRALGIDDALEGGAGSNVLSGGLFSDCFVFDVGDGGHHEIADLERWDYLRFDGFGYDSPDDLRDHMVEEDTGVVFSDQGVTVVFVGMNLSDIADDMFIL
ncbi:DUF4214 domain-containing protein [Salipiger sp. P9]|uniref:DUF4214 domain-containing protein n=1 Tax=Salipiger pentaromativorans TaxID=2943193 RepID=UPI00215820C4|nr:DUF4214 domain-containing protein [Salipiger pentaromativorans]MCR8550912.1 DUF4214 domain-containing protein [Salipiger pentaromativorans]